jgi:hypothetical protein
MYELSTYACEWGGWAASATRALVCGGVAGVSYNVAFHPVDVVRANMMNTDLTAGGVRAVTRRLLAHGGVAALYRGVFVTTIRALPVNAVGMWTLAVVQGFVDHRRALRCAGGGQGSRAPLLRRPTMELTSSPPVIERPTS